MSNIKTRFVRPDDEKQIIALLKEMTDKPINFQIENVIEDKNCHAIVLENENEEVIGFGALVVHLVPAFGYVGSIEDVVVGETFRGQGLGGKLMDELIRVAKDQKVIHINLTSRPERVASHKLYLKKGFFLRDTGVYRLNLE
ncbi:MAG: GNAT family N-acetyltransferase [Candidatus Moraniibacteriota bacterium]